MRFKIIAAAAAGAALLVAPAAAAPTTQVTGGKTVLKPDQATFEGFADMSISVGTTGSASDNVHGVTLPITAGEIDESGPSGGILHRGGIVFSQNTPGGATLKFSKLLLRISHSGKAKLFATKNGEKPLRFLDVDLSDADFDGLEGVSLVIKHADATLAKPAAELMSEEFDFPFEKGIPVGELTTKAEFPG
jgi:hypothetical protein